MFKFNRQGNKGRQKYQNDSLDKTEDNLKEISETMQNFKKYAAELDKKHDKFERIVKLNRDITIESKRIIFFLHTIDRESKRVSVLNEAETRLEALVSHQWKSVASELHNEDPYLFHKAFSAGMQEFLEAFIFYNYLKNETFLHWNFYQDKLKYFISKVFSEPSSEEKKIKISTILVPFDYILGLADTTGELMRKCINNLGEGDFDGCFKTCNFVRNVYAGFLTIGAFGNREMSHKVFTLRQSLLKMEMVCYNIHVRGSEVPKYMLADVDTQKTYAAETEEFFT